MQAVLLWMNNGLPAPTSTPDPEDGNPEDPMDHHPR